MYKAYKEARLLNYQICGRHIFTHKHTPFIFSRLALHQVLWNGSEKRDEQKHWVHAVGMTSRIWGFRVLEFSAYEI